MPSRSESIVLAILVLMVAAGRALPPASDAKAENLARVEYYRQAIRKQPSAPELHFQLGMQLWDLGRLAEARSALRTELRLNPANQRCRVVLGMIEVQQNEFRTAISHLGSALHADPGLTQAYYPLGQAWFHSGDFEKALEFLEKAARVETPAPALYALLARTHFKLGRKQDAAAMSKLHTASRNLGLAEAAANLGSWAEADRLVSEYLAAFPDASAGLYVKAGIALNGFRKLDEATALLERILARDPNNFKARRLLAVLEWTAGDKPAFEKNMGIVLAADPLDGQAQYYIGRYLLEKGDTAQARERLATAERLRPFDYRVATDLARAYARAGLLDKAEEKHRAAVSLLGQWPERDPLVYANYAEFLLEQRKPEQARELLGRITSAPRPLPRALYLAGVACKEEGRLDEAVVFLKRAEASAPDDPRIHLALAEVYERAGNKSEADAQRARASKPGAPR